MYTYSILENEWNTLYYKCHSVYLDQYKSDYKIRWYQINNAMSPHLCLDYIKKNIQHDDCLYANPQLDITHIYNLKNIHWGWLSKNPNLTWDYIYAHRHETWDWTEISKQSIITPEIMNSYSLPWCWKGLVHNPSMNWDVIKNCPDKQLYLSECPWITMQFVVDYPEEYWDFTKLSSHPNIQIKDIIQYPNFAWDFNQVSLNSNITWQDVQENSHFNWNYSNLSKNKNITFQTIHENNQIQWNWDHVSMNTNIHWDHVVQNPDLPWNYDKLLFNYMEGGKSLWIHDKRTQIIKSLQIQRYWRYYTCNPIYTLAQKKIMEVYYKLS